MPVTKETIIAVEPLKALTEEQISAIVTLSTNVEQKAIDETTNKIHSGYDTDIERITGVKKKPDEKSYHLLQNVLTELVEKSAGAGKVTELQIQLEALKKEKGELEAKIKDGVTDATTKQRIAELEQKVHDKDTELTTFKTAAESEKTKLASELEQIRQRATTLELETEAQGYFNQNKVAFKQSIPESVRLEIMQTRRSQLLQTIKPDLIDDGKGGKIRVFRDEKGDIMRNPNNKLEPFTFGELYLSRLSDLVDAKPAGGGGTGAGGGGGNGVSLDLAGAKTQVAADEVIVEYLIKTEGLAKSNPKFYDRQKEIRKEHGVDKLPIS